MGKGACVTESGCVHTQSGIRRLRPEASFEKYVFLTFKRYLEVMFSA